jgi:hypothetical protein
MLLLLILLLKPLLNGRLFLFRSCVATVVEKPAATLHEHDCCFATWSMHAVGARLPSAGA